MTADRLVSRVRAMDPDRVDTVLALLVLAETQIEAAFVNGDAATVINAHLVGIGVAACLAFHRRHTLTAFFAVQLLFIFSQAQSQVFTDTLVLPLFVILFMNV